MNAKPVPVVASISVNEPGPFAIGDPVTWTVSQVLRWIADRLDITWQVG